MFIEHSQFYKAKETEQKPDEVVDVTGWAIGSLSEYPEGARDKYSVESPPQVPYKFLIPNHKYLLKKTYTVKKTGSILYEQYWNEIIAYKLGRVLGIKVPPAFVAHYHKEGSEPFYGTLIEWFYGYDGNDEAKRGGDIITRYVDGYDTGKGEKHNFQTIVEIFEKEKVENWLQEWTEILLFDTIIGNTDRHQDNWQIIDYVKERRRLVSPAFDNGTSLGYNVRPEHLGEWLNKLEKHANKGTHHMKWALADEKKAGHFEMLEKLIKHFPSAESYIKAKLTIDISGISDDITHLVEFRIEDDRYKLSKGRAEFIIKLLLFRYAKIKRMFGL